MNNDKDSNKSSNSSNNNSNEKSNSEENPQQQEDDRVNNTVDPYAILNISTNASIKEIEKSYKLLSRSFHPDKQPNSNRDQAQEYFVQLKGAYDILTDPVQKFALDHFGYEGVTFLKRHAKLHEKIASLLRQKQEEDNVDDDADIEKKAKYLFSEALQFYNFEVTSMKLNKPTISGSVKVNCNTTHSILLQEGIEPLSLDVDQTKLALSISQPAHSHSKIGFSCGASSSLKSTTGEGSANGDLSLEYEPVQGTELRATVASEINMTTIEGKKKQEPRITLGSSRIMRNRTYVNASLSAPLKSMFHFITAPNALTNTLKKKEDSNDWMVTLTSHRSLFEDKIRCTWIAGIGLPDTKLQYGMISISSNNKSQEQEDDDDDDDDDDNSHDQNDSRDDHGNKQSQKTKAQKYWSKPAKHTLKLNIGMSHTPIQITTEKKLSDNQSGAVSFGYGMMGSDFKILSTRSISKFCKLSLGVHHVTATGLSTLFRIERGSMNLSVPILVSTRMSPAYAMKSLYVTLFMSLVDAMVGDIVDEDYLNITQDVQGKDDTMMNKGTMASSSSFRSHEDMLMEREKMKRDRLQQIQLMSKSAEAKMRKEELKDNGLVILMAKYEVNGGDSIDVTIALQFWVMNSSLHLPSMSKSNMLGFYDVRRETAVKMESGFWQAWREVLVERFVRRNTGIVQTQKQEDTTSTPTLTVRYRHDGSVYEITILDDEELSLPSRNAMKLGGAYVT
jgi:curved DNA-binding protein CbpA